MKLNYRHSVFKSWWGLIVGMTLIATSEQGQAQVVLGTDSVSVSGRISTMTGLSVTVDSNSGPVVVKLADNTVIRNEVPVAFSDITSGMYVGATAQKQPDGTFRASRLHIFSEDQRGVGEGHRPLGSAPQSGQTMTNANVETVQDVTVEKIRGRMLTLKYKDDTIKVIVPENTPVVKRVTGDHRLLRPGTIITASGPRAEDGAIVASQITVRAEAK
jgi:hypothetical protein